MSPCTQTADRLAATDMPNPVLLSPVGRRHGRTRPGLGPDKARQEPVEALWFRRLPGPRSPAMAFYLWSRSAIRRLIAAASARRFRDRRPIQGAQGQSGGAAASSSVTIVRTDKHRCQATLLPRTSPTTPPVAARAGQPSTGLLAALVWVFSGRSTLLAQRGGGTGFVRSRDS